MLIFLTALFFFIFTSPVLAAPRICKFHAQDTNDWIEICNDSGTVDLSLYYVADLDQTNKKYLNCTFNTAINVPLSQILNNAGDTISLIEISSGNSVSTVRYCDSSKSTCPPDSDVVDIKDSMCGLINPDDTRTVSSDAAICTPLPVFCPVSSTPPSPTSISPSSPPAASASLETSITNLNSSASLGQNLSLSFSINSNLPDAEFYIKAFGGVNDDYSIETQNNSNWYNYNASWTDMPKIKTGSDGKYSGQITIRPKPDKETGNYRVQIKVRALPGSPEKISGITYLSVSSTPTQTPAPTSSLTPSPTPTPSPSLTPTPEPTQYSQSAVLAATDTNFSPTSTPAPSPQTRPTINVPVMLMILGSLLLLTPLAISKFPHAKI